MGTTRFVQKTDTLQVQPGGRSGTPILEMPNITKGNTLRVTATFLANTAGQANSGFSYKIQPTQVNEALALSSQESTVQGNAGWQTTTKTVFFEAVVNNQTGVEDIDFEVIFEKGSLDGAGNVSQFLLTAEIVGLDRS